LELSGSLALAAIPAKIKDDAMPLDGWDLAILAVAIYAAATTLMRLMQFRRQELVDRLKEEMEAEKRRLSKAKKKQAAQEQS